METVQSKNGVSVRLSEERWLHITEEHSEMAGYYFEILETVESPEVIYRGATGECIALREIEKDKCIIAIYRELSKKDGFIITAFLTRKKQQFERRIKLWPV